MGGGPAMGLSPRDDFLTPLAVQRYNAGWPFQAQARLDGGRTSRCKIKDAEGGDSRILTPFALFRPMASSEPEGAKMR